MDLKHEVLDICQFCSVLFAILKADQSYQLNVKFKGIAEGYFHRSKFFCIIDVYQLRIF